MKSKCKTAKVTIELIERSIHKCLKPTFKRKKNGCVRLFSRVYGLSEADMRTHMIARDTVYDDAVAMVAAVMFKQYTNRHIEVPKPYVRKKVRDHSSGKLRDIATLSMLHQFWDYVLVELLDDMMPIIGTYQCASIKGRGQKHGYDAIKRWTAGYAGRRFYAVKLDVCKCYDSILKENLIAFFFKRTRNKDLRWLLELVINLSPSPGLLIGSYFAQFACNMYMSQVYHYASERIRYRGKNPIDHVLGYMDDFLLLGRNKKALQVATHELIAYAESLGLPIKPTWEVYEVTNRRPIDMLGFTFYTDRVKVRSRIYLRMKRCIRTICGGCMLTLRRALRLISYKGFAVMSCVGRRYHRQFSCLFLAAQRRISYCTSR